jgi:hypothetical protein
MPKRCFERSEPCGAYFVFCHRCWRRAWISTLVCPSADQVRSTSTAGKVNFAALPDGRFRGGFLYGRVSRVAAESQSSPAWRRLTSAWPARAGCSRLLVKSVDAQWWRQIARRRCPHATGRLGAGALRDPGQHQREQSVLLRRAQASRRDRKDDHGLRRHVQHLDGAVHAVQTRPPFCDYCNTRRRVASSTATLNGFCRMAAALSVDFGSTA